MAVPRTINLEIKLNAALDVLARIELKVDQIEERLRFSEVANARFGTELKNLHAKETYTTARLEKTESIFAETASKASLQRLEERVVRLEPPVKVILWAGGLLGAAALTLLWALITQQAVLTLP